jgi:DNA-binding GntR family transcriptional regulator
MNMLAAAEGHIARRSGLVDEVYRRIRADIMSLRIPPDARISVDNLARELGVSQTPIREALSMLEANQLVSKKHFVGYCAAPRLSLAQLGELFEFRELIEPHAARKAALGLTERAARELTDLTDQMESGRSEPHNLFADLDTEFHRLIARTAGNNLIADSLARLHIHVHIFRSSFGHELADEAQNEHRRILAAILGRDADTAEAEMRAHIGNSFKRMRRFIGE